jgi:hypothetical protein
VRLLTVIGAVFAGPLILRSIEDETDRLLRSPLFERE